MIPLFENLNNLTGLIPHDEGMELLRLAQKVPGDQAVVEIGSFKGKSTCYLAAGRFMSGGGGLVYAVDPWDLPGNPYGKHGFSASTVRGVFDAQVASLGFGEIVCPVRGFSVNVARDWEAKVGMLFIDGDHSEQAVHDDLFAWLPHMADGGVLAFDDFDTPRNPGVRKVVDRFAKASGLPYAVLAERLAVFHLGVLFRLDV